METKQEKREEIMKVLQMVEEGKIDQDKALSMIAMLEGKDVIGGVKGIVQDPKSRKKRFFWGAVGLALSGALLYGLFFYLPIHAPFESVALVYGFLGLLVLCGTLVAVSAIGVGRLAVKKHG